MTHELRCWAPFYQAVADGIKTVEVRHADRPYAVGDTLLLREYVEGEYTGRQCSVVVTHITTYDEFPQGLKFSYFALSIRKETLLGRLFGRANKPLRRWNPAYERWDEKETNR